MNLNKVFILGRLTDDPQLRTTPGGQSVAAFSIATNRVWTDKSGSKQEDTQYHNIVAWGRQAEVISQFLNKGSLVLIEGRIQTRGWQDKEGRNRKTTEIIAERVQFGPRSAQPSGSGNSRSPQRIDGGQANKSSGPGDGESDEKPEDIPVINIDGGDDDIKAEDLPF